MKELKTTTYISDQYTDQDTLYANMLTDPATVSAELTFLYGDLDSSFPLHMLTEGQGAFGSITPKNIALNDTQYTWPTMGVMKHTTEMVRLSNASNTAPGIGNTTFKAVFRDNMLHVIYSVYSPDFKHCLRAQSEPRQIASNEFEVDLALISGNSTEYVTLDNFAAGKFWAIGPTSVAGSLSDGTTSNSMAPGKMTNQFGWQRYTKVIAGNIANKVVVYNMPAEDGGTTNKWIPFEMKLWELERRALDEDGLWFDTYNRDTYGKITLFDPDTNKPIPHGAGVKQIIKGFGYYATYGPILTLNKINAILDIIFTNRIDKTPTELVIYTGTGGGRMWHNAIMNDARANQFFTVLGEQSVRSGKDGYMSYGSYFNQYKTIDGRIITVKVNDFFNKGIRAETQKQNGDMWQGLPYISYDMVLMDHSTSDKGMRNILLVSEKGRENISGIYRGLTPLPDTWRVAAGTNVQLSTTKDIAKYEVMTSKGICITNPTTSFWLEFQP